MKKEDNHTEESKGLEAKEDPGQTSLLFQAKAPLIIDDDMNMGLHEIDERFRIYFNRLLGHKNKEKEKKENELDATDRRKVSIKIS